MGQVVMDIFMYLNEMVLSFGYIGIIVLMCIESSFLPVPSEITMIPAGYLAYQGKMDLSLVILSGLVGSILGAWLNYYLAMSVGREFVRRYGPYVGVSHTKMQTAERFFLKHGAFSTLIGRLIPVVRHLISLPAGFAKMPFLSFIICTAIGSAIWSSFLVLLGYYMGSNEGKLVEYLNQGTSLLFGAVIAAIIGYICFIKYQKTQERKLLRQERSLAD